MLAKIWPYRWLLPIITQSYEKAQSELSWSSLGWIKQNCPLFSTNQAVQSGVCDTAAIHSSVAMQPGIIPVFKVLSDKPEAKPSLNYTQATIESKTPEETWNVTHIPTHSAWVSWLSADVWTLSAGPPEDEENTCRQRARERVQSMMKGFGFT